MIVPEAEPPDLCDLYKASKMLWNAQQQMNLMVEEVASARVIKDNHSERSKQALARAMKRAGDVPISKAEMLGRCDDKYVAEHQELINHLELAEKTLLRFMVLQTRIDGLRTLISAQKATMNL